MPTQRKFPLALKGCVIFLVLVPSLAIAAPLRWADCPNLLKGGWWRADDGSVMPAGPYRGRRLSQGTPSPALQILPHDHALRPEGTPEAAAVVANFVTSKGPALAVVPEDPPLLVSMLRELEVDGTYHLMLRLVFPPGSPIKYWSQNLEGILEPPREVRDVVIDFGTHRVEGDERNPYTAWRGLVGRYALQSRMGTTWFKARRIWRDRRTVVEYPMSLSFEQKVRLMDHFFKRTREIMQGEMYNSALKNCATEFSLMLNALGVAPDGRLNCLLHTGVSWTPSGLLWSLQRRGFHVANRGREVYVVPAERF